MEVKYVLVLGDDDEVVDSDRQLQPLVDAALNFTQSPSVGAIFKLYAEDAQKFAESHREEGHKVGVYSTKSKAVFYLESALNLE